MGMAGAHPVVLKSSARAHGLASALSFHLSSKTPMRRKMTLWQDVIQIILFDLRIFFLFS